MNDDYYYLKVIEGDVNDLQAVIRSPSGHEEPCLLKKLSNGSLGISFTPREVGEHIVSVHRDGKHIKNSPFRIEVRQSEIGDASRVRLYGSGLAEGSANLINEFYVNTKEAGENQNKYFLFLAGGTCVNRQISSVNISKRKIRQKVRFFALNRQFNYY